ncbi:MAG: sugar phosphate isomerase/epimerase [Oscillospiraceae bacterium]|nr:sugar phosphate isomerase/epimerase [Oscillospiraceae bacterium]
MLKIGIETAISSARTLEDVYRYIADAGFDGVDASLNKLLTHTMIRNREMPTAFSDEKTLLDAAAPFGDAAKRYGLETFQAHAPFPPYSGDAAYDAKLQEMFIWFVHACDAIGCRKLVVHPVLGLADFPLSWEEELEKTVALYASLIPAAKQYGVMICTENMFRTQKCAKNIKKVEEICSDIPEACEMLDDLNALAGEKLFGFCLDTGHLLLLGKDVARAMVQLGDRLAALHIHDNNGLVDQHLGPYMGIQDWDRFVDGIVASNYRGVLSFETGTMWNRFDPALLPSALKFLAETGRLFAQRAEERR